MATVCSPAAAEVEAAATFLRPAEAEAEVEVVLLLPVPPHTKAEAGVYATPEGHTYATPEGHTYRHLFPSSVKFVDWLATTQRFLFIANFLPMLATERMAKLEPRLHIGKIQESSSRWDFATRICALRRDNPWKLLDKNPVRHEKTFQL